MALETTIGPPPLEAGIYTQVEKVIIRQPTSEENSAGYIIYNITPRSYMASAMPMAFSVAISHPINHLNNIYAHDVIVAI